MFRIVYDRLTTTQWHVASTPRRSWRGRWAWMRTP